MIPETSVSCQGPGSYENWKAKLRGIEPGSTGEYPLLTDAHITGDEYRYGPYLLLNALAFPPSSEYRAGIVLRVDRHVRFDDMMLDLGRTDASRYHGGTLVEEVAALVSLCLGIRVKCGGCTREFDPTEDPRGRPVGYRRDEDPMLPKPPNPNQRVLPGFTDPRSL